MSKIRGVTLLELVLASALLMMLTTAIFAAWSAGSKSWLVAARSSDRQREVNRLMRLLVRQLDGCSAASLQLGSSPGAISYLLPFGLRSAGEADRYTALPGWNSPAWRKYCVFWHVPADHQVLWREVEVPAGHAVQADPVPIASFNDGSGLHPLSFYCSAGKVAASGIDVLEFGRTGAVLAVHVASRDGRGEFDLRTAVAPRN